MGMCYYIRSIPEVLYYIPIAEQIPKFNEKFLLGISDILIGYWWPRSDTESRIKAFDKLIDYLGGKDNIISTEVNLSRFKVNLRNISIVNKEAIQKLGAKGIVEIDNQLKIILGPNSKQLKKYIDDLK